MQTHIQTRTEKPYERHNNKTDKTEFIEMGQASWFNWFVF